MKANLQGNGKTPKYEEWEGVGEREEAKGALPVRLPSLSDQDVSVTSTSRTENDS